jgi:hypothetical protein
MHHHKNTPSHLDTKKNSPPTKINENVDHKPHITQRHTWNTGSEKQTIESSRGHVSIAKFWTSLSNNAKTAA